jgi:NAD+--asparagine ADP-ribosyltransferase
MLVVMTSLMTSLNNWVDARLKLLADEITSTVSNDVGLLIANLETKLTADIANSVEQVVDNTATNTEKVITTVGGTVTNTIDHFTIDTASLAQAVAQAIKGLLPPFLTRKPDPQSSEAWDK